MKRPEVTAAVAEAPLVALPEARQHTLMGDFAQLTKARLSTLVLLTTAFGFTFGSSHGIDWFLLFRVTFGTAFVAASAAVMNQFFERKVDRLMARTKDRPLPAGRMYPGTALGLGVFLGVAGLIYLQNRVSPLCAQLAAGTWLVYVAMYTPMKRKSAWCVMIGAVSGAIPPMIGWAAATGSLGAGAWILFGILFFWQMPHFLALAWMYRDEYAQAGFCMLRPRDFSGLKAAMESLVSAIALLVVTLVPVYLGLAHSAFIPIALACDGWLLLRAVLFLAHRNRTSAKRLFLASILFLPLIMALLVACRR